MTSTVHETAATRREHVRTAILPALDCRPFVGGRFVDAATDRRFKTVEPFSGHVLAGLPDCGEADVAAAVGAARHAFDEGAWSRGPAVDRAACLRRLASLIESAHDELALLESSDVGKPISSTRAWDISNAAEVYRYYADLAELPQDEPIPGTDPGRAVTRTEPLGVVAAIVPWNFPFPCIAWKLAPALAAGCTVVLKSAERAPLSAQLLAGLFERARFPPGVINVIPGLGAATGRALVSDPRVDAISFTGGPATAGAIAAASARRLPRLTFELGGKGANLVWRDADLEAAVAGTIPATFDVAGQNCCAGSRTIVHRDVADAFAEKLVEAAARRVLGDPLDDETEQGPQIDLAHVRHIDGFVREATDAGARVLVGGAASGERGAFYLPTILDRVGRDARIAREEVFGPVGCLFVVDDLDDAIALTNDSDLGLSASVWSHDEAVLDAFVARAEVGVCWVNTFGLFDITVPWGGRRRSGYGRELGYEALRSFTDRKTVYRERGPATS